MKKSTLWIAIFCMLFSSVFAQTNGVEDHVKGEMLVQLNSGYGIRSLLNKAPEELRVKLNRELSAPMRVWLLDYDEDNNSIAKMQNWLYAQEEVSLVDINVIVQLRATEPGDPMFNQQWHHVNTGQTGGTADADIDSDLAWDITTGGTSATNDDIVVCMIESGDLDHPDLSPNRWINTAEIPNNNIDDDGNGYIDDYNGWNPLSDDDNTGSGWHGTNCLGMIGAKGDNNSMVVGANWDVKMMVIGGYNINSQADIVEAYTYPLVMRRRWNQSNGTQGAFVVATSASWGLDNTQASTRPIWCQFYDTLGHAGILNAGATTNNNSNVDVNGDVPTGCASPYMIGVGRTDHNDQWEGGYGPIAVDLGAPGVDVLTTANTNTTTVTTGTSYSCPLTAGVIGLAYSIPCPNFMAIVKNDPKTGADLVLNALFKGVDVKAHLASRYGTSGRLNAKNTLDTLMNATCSGNICIAPNGNATVTGDNTASITFNPFASATASNVYWREVGASTWTEVLGASSPLNLTGLTECTEYEFYFTSTCDTETSPNSSVQTFKTTGCGTCVEQPYCTSTATQPADEYINEFVIDAYTNTSGQNDGYGDFTNSSSIDLNKNQAYNFTVTPGWNGTQYNEHTRIWVDLDHNGTFEASEMLYDQGTADQNVVNGSITIPTTATSGNTRMRVQMAYQGTGQNTLPDICGDFNWGEVEDYCVNILSPASCNLSLTSSSTNVSCNGVNDGTMTIANVSGGTPSYTYQWSDNLGTNASVSNVAAGGYTVLVADASGCDTTVSFVITEPSAITLNSDITQPDCNGASTGAIAISNVSGGAGNYSFQWSGGNGTNQSLSNIGAGSYTLTITDASTCTSEETFTLNNPALHTSSFSSSANELTVSLTNTSTGNGSYSWDFGDGTTSTDANPTHTYATEGTYEICLTHTTNCGNYESCENVNVTTQGIEDNISQSVLVYPNPAQDLVNFKVTNGKVAQIAIVDILGKTIFQTNVVSDLTQIQLGNLAKGQYLYQLKDEKGQVLFTNKLTITK